jgi:hypothetical protein
MMGDDLLSDNPILIELLCNAELSFAKHLFLSARQIVFEEFDPIKASENVCRAMQMTPIDIERRHYLSLSLSLFGNEC